MNNLVDVWFTMDQLKTIKHCLDDYYNDHSNDSIEPSELKPVLEHLEHLIEHYKN